MSTKIVKDILKERAKSGTTIFMSTHLLSIAEELCDRIAIIKNGKIIFEIKAKDFQTIKENYNGKFEQLFLELTKDLK